MMKPDFNTVYRSVIGACVIYVTITTTLNNHSQEIKQITREIDNIKVDQSRETVARQKMQEKLYSVEKALAILVESNKVNERQDRLLLDHEERLRSIEFKVWNSQKTKNTKQ